MSGRRELEVAAGPAAIPREFVELLPAVTRGRDLAEAAKGTRRTSVEVHQDGAVAEVALDNVTVLDGPARARPLRRARGRAARGRRRRPRANREGLRRAGASEEWLPKLFRALGIEPPQDARIPSGAPPLDHLAPMLGLQYEAILQHDPGTRLGADSEDLHKFRVATRRLRALLRAARPLLDHESAEGLRSELSWLGSGSGPVRDLDVMLEHLRAEVAEVPHQEAAAGRLLVRAVQAEHGEARAGMLEALASSRYFALLDRVESAAREPRAGGVQETGLREIGAEFRRLRKAVRRLPPDYTDDELHRVRIKTKRARYAAELAEGAVGKKATACRPGERPAGRHRRAPGRDRRRGAHPLRTRLCGWREHRVTPASLSSGSVSGAGRPARSGPVPGRSSNAVGARAGPWHRSRRGRCRHTAGGRSARGAARAPAQIRRLDVPEGKASIYERRGLRPAGGG